jgi:glycosyltransferase involved in cell wall biosynthesis
MSDYLGKGDSMPKVSIVLPAHNEENEIESAIREMIKQTYRNREIIVVDDGSSDNTLKTASAAIQGLSDVRMVEAKHGGPSYARNLGFRESSGTVIFFGECDCVYDADYVEKAVAALNENPDAGAVCLTGAPLVTRSTLATDCIELENKVQHKLLNEGKIKPFYAWVFRRGALEKAGGFDEKLFQAEDKDLFGRVVRSGYKIAWVPGVHWKHKRSETLSSLSRKWFVRGKTRVLYSVKNRLLLDLAKTILPFWLFILGLVLLPFYPIYGIILVALVLISFLLQTARIKSVSVPDIHKRGIYVKYYIFLIVRNFSSSLGYVFGLLKMVS